MVNYFINMCSDVVVGTVNHFGSSLVPGAVGAFGGWATGIGPQRGFIQGLSTGAWNAVILTRAKKWVDHNSSTKVDRLNNNSVNLLYFIGTISSIGIPMLLTAKFGDDILAKAGSFLPKDKQWLIIPSSDHHHYTYFRGLLTEITPNVISLYLSIFR